MVKWRELKGEERAEIGKIFFTGFEGMALLRKECFV